MQKLPNIINVMALQPDGKIVVFGSCDTGSMAPKRELAGERFLANGDPDSTFGLNGKVIVPIGSGVSVQAIALQPDGKIVIAVAYMGDFMLTRLETNGSQDPSFGINGIVSTSIGTLPYDKACALAIQNDGKIIAGGTSYHSLYNYASMVRYNSNGTIDNSFGVNGIVTTPILGQYDLISHLNLQNDQKIIATGYSLVSSSGSTVDNAMFVLRYDTTGSLDISFASGGEALINPGNYDDKAYSAVIQPDGKIVIGGYMTNTNFNPDFALFRLKTNGETDSSFGINGLVRTDFYDSSAGVHCLDYAYSLLQQADGKLVLSGYNSVPMQQRIAIARYINHLSLGLIETAISKASVYCYPNPLSNVETLQFQLNKCETIQIDLTDAQGRFVCKLVEPAQLQSGNQQITLHIPSTIAAGSYLLQLKNKQGTLATVKVIK